MQDIETCKIKEEKNSEIVPTEDSKEKRDWFQFCCSLIEEKQESPSKKPRTEERNSLNISGQDSK